MKKVLTLRQKKLIDILIKEDIFCTALSLSKLLNISVKTVQNEISTINEQVKQPMIFSQKGKGYQILDKQKVLDILEHQYDRESRRDIKILKEILLHTYVNYYDLADMFYISPSTLNKEIQHLNRKIKREFSELKIERKLNNLSLNCDEFEKRKVLTFFLLEESENQSFDLSVLDSYFDSINVIALSEVLIEYAKKQQREMTDFNMLSVLLHILVIMSNSNNLVKAELSFILPDDELSFIRDIEKQMNNHFTLQGVDNIRQVVKKRQFAVSKKQSEYVEFLSMVFKEVFDVYSINFNENNELKAQLASHLKNLEIRCNNESLIKNPLLEQFKLKFILVYDIAVYISMRFTDVTSCIPNQDEIGFIGLHILNALQSVKKMSVKLAIINPYGNSIYQIIKRRLDGISDIEIIGNFSMFDFKTIYKEKPDIIISLVTIPEIVGFSVYKINNYLLSKEYLKIEKLIKNVRVKNAYENIIIRNYFFEELFVINDNLKTKQDIIAYLCEKLECNGYVNSDFIEHIYQRESIAPTCFGYQYAIPHTSKKIANKNGIAVMILKEPILWDGFEIKIVLMFALHKSFDQIPKLYDFIINAFEDHQRFNRILDSNSFGGFIHQLI